MQRLGRTNVIVLTIALLLENAYAKVPRELEPDYAEAVIAYNGRKYDQALRLIDELLKRSPDTIEFLELKALTIQGTDKKDTSEKLYRNLIAAKTKAGKDEEETAPYHYELGMMAFRKGKHEEARRSLEVAAKYDFNEGATHYILGLITYKAGDWANSRDHFDEVLSSNAEDLKTAAHFYLAQVNMKTAFTAGATHHLNEAKNSAESSLSNPGASENTKKVATQIKQSASKALKPLDRSVWYGSASLTQGYDSNVIAAPDTTATGKASVATNIRAGIGYVTSPLNEFQFIPNYSFASAINFNGDTSAGNFATNTLGVFANRAVLSDFSQGFKFSTSYTFRKSGNNDFGSYSLIWTIGPYGKIRMSRAWNAGMELFVNFQNFFADDTATDANKRGGTKFTTRWYFQSDTGSRWWNPTFSFTGYLDLTKGTEFDATQFGLNFSNVFYIDDKWKGALSFGYANTNYTGSTAGRKDNNLSLKYNTSFKLFPGFKLLGELAYTLNSSNQTANKYNRFALFLGMSYSFL